MAVFFLIIVVVAALHFVYEGIVGASLRMRLRYQIFRERDRLRTLKITHRDQLDAETFQSLHDSLNTAIRLLPVVTISTLVQIQGSVERDEALRQCIKHRQEKLRLAEIEDVRAIHQSIGRTLTYALWVNTAGLLAWLWPVFAVVILLKWVGKVVRAAVLVPSGEIDKVAALHSRVTESRWCAQ